MAINNKPRKTTNALQTRKKLPKKKKSKKKKSKNILKGICFGFIFCFLAILVICAGYAFAVIKTTPPLNVDAVLTLNQPSSIYDSDGKFMDNMQTDEERYVIDSSKIPSNLKNAFVSIEDERFYTHSGIDVKRILGAAFLDVKRLITGQKGLHGASTLTQQLLKNTILTNDISIERKIKEAYLAINLEKALTKDQILTAYLNTIPLGGHVYGVEAASLYYFGKNTKDLSLIECAYIAGITQAPSLYSAYSNEKDPTPYINRTITVLSQMNKLNYIDDAKYEEAVNSVKNGGLVFKSSKQNYRLNYEWFVYPAVSQVKEDLKEKYKYTDEEVSKLLINGGLKIYTTMDRNLQDYTQKTLDNYKNLKVSNKETYDSDGVPLLQASATIMDYRTGHVLAMVGGRGKQNPQSLNRAYNDLRPIGSSIKPLTVYGPGIDLKLMTAASPINDAPIPTDIGKKYSNTSTPYNPLNSPNEYSGTITAREALTHSKNTAAVLFEDKIGLKNGISYGEKLGLKFNSASKSSMAAVALGQFNNSPNDRDGGNTSILAAAYGTFGNNGVYTKPMLYTKVVDSNGKTLLDNTTPKQTKVFSPQAAYILYDMLKGPVTEYNATGAKWGDMPVAGKTGTTSNSTDLWFAGLSPYLSGSVWIGYDSPKQLYGSSSGCAEIWGQLMKKAHESYSVKDIAEPSGIVKVNVCKDSGDLSTLFCNLDIRGSRVYQELFIDGTEPTTNCTVHSSSNKFNINNKDSSKDSNNENNDVKDTSPNTEANEDSTLTPPVVGSVESENQNKTDNQNSNNNSNSNSNTHNSNGPGNNSNRSNNTNSN